jgi:hypothetical protein
MTVICSLKLLVKRNGLALYTISRTIAVPQPHVLDTQRVTELP